ncbi:MAG: sterol desaturase family protein [Verrucomicrobia bacterium]|nr:sterol desaturase family protein [Verrucomicrobiota bacterium]
MTELSFSTPGWRAVLAVGLLTALLAWETAQPFFTLFGRAGDRARHGVRNLALGALNAAIVALLFAGAWLAVTQWAAAHRFGILNGLELPPWPRATLAVLMLDGWMYFWHWLNHQVPLFWRFHRLHHADRAMDVTTASRFHTGEIVLSSIFRLPVLLLLGCRIEELALYELLLFAVVQFHHANIALPARLDRWLRLLIVTPSVHKVHHSVVRAECDSNFSSLFSWWDPLFRTQRIVRDPQRIVFGIGE